MQQVKKEKDDESKLRMKKRPWLTTKMACWRDEMMIYNVLFMMYDDNDEVW